VKRGHLNKFGRNSSECYPGGLNPLPQIINSRNNPHENQTKPPPPHDICHKYVFGGGLPLKWR